MIELFVMGGPYVLLLGVLGLVVLALSVKKGIDLFARTGLEPERLGRGLNAILFWGCFSAVLGFLGQFAGLYRSLMVIRGAGLIHPGLVAEGIAVALISTVFGLTILAFAGVVWFGLSCRMRSLTRA
jgi:biopolymer transport protein ExbB/TolQ